MCNIILKLNEQIKFFKIELSNGKEYGMLMMGLRYALKEVKEGIY